MLPFCLELLIALAIVTIVILYRRQPLNSESELWSFVGCYWFERYITKKNVRKLPFVITGQEREREGERQVAPEELSQTNILDKDEVRGTYHQEWNCRLPGPTGKMIGGLFSVTVPENCDYQ
eukprot:583166-Amphidinium_carterae.1